MLVIAESGGMTWKFDKQSLLSTVRLIFASTLGTICDLFSVFDDAASLNDVCVREAGNIVCVFLRV